MSLSPIQSFAKSSLAVNCLAIDLPLAITSTFGESKKPVRHFYSLFFSFFGGLLEVFWIYKRRLCVCKPHSPNFLECRETAEVWQMLGQVDMYADLPRAW